MAYLLAMKPVMGLLILFAVPCLSVMGQDSKPIDVLKKGLQDAKTDTGRARLLIALGWEFRNTTPDSGLHYEVEGLALAEKIGDRMKIAQADFSLAKLYYTLSDNDRSIRYFTSALQVFEQLKDTLDMILVHSQMGYAYDRLTRRAECLNEFLLALKLAEKAGNAEKTSDVLLTR